MYFFYIFIQKYVFNISHNDTSQIKTLILLTIKCNPSRISVSITKNIPIQKFSNIEFQPQY